MTMTRNKAIQVLDNERKEYIIKGCQLDKAIDMAIEALKEQEISNELQEYAYECGYEHFFHECQNCEYRRGVHSHCKPTHGRLIDADALKGLMEKRKQFFVDAYGGSFHCMSKKDKARCDEIDACIASIVNAPTVQADRPHGEWIKQNNELKISEYQCSECGYYQDDGSNFCPNCGTRMYKGGDEE